MGSLSDPVHLPGLAHFCEHMLFLGSQKFPDENEYQKFISLHGGCCNAYTSSDHTNYYFDVLPEHLSGALDRFSQFFLSPLFTESATEREVNAVNSEHEKNIPNDYRRELHIEKSLCDPSHVFSKFGTGNKESLTNSLNLRESLIEFHSTWYSSNIMTLAVLGREDLDTLEDVVLEYFEGVKDKKVMVPEWTDPPFPEDFLGTMTYIVPIKDERKLVLKWGIPDLTKHYQTKPGQFISYLVQHEGVGSLLSRLKKKGWANSINAGCGNGSKGFEFFEIRLDITEEGIKHVDDIIMMVFQYLTLLRNQGVEE